MEPRKVRLNKSNQSSVVISEPNAKFDAVATTRAEFVRFPGIHRSAPIKPIESTSRSEPVAMELPKNRTDPTLRAAFAETRAENLTRRRGGPSSEATWGTGQRYSATECRTEYGGTFTNRAPVAPANLSATSQYKAAVNPISGLPLNRPCAGFEHPAQGVPRVSLNAIAGTSQRISRVA